MVLVSGTRSSLNPKAEPFIPMAYQQVEDFSPAWWELVKASSWYRDYWLSQHGDDDFGADDCGDAFDFDEDDDDMIPEIIDDEFMFVDELEGVDKRESGGSDPMGVGEEERKLLNADAQMDAKALLKDRSTLSFSLSLAYFLVADAEMDAKALLKDLSTLSVSLSPSCFFVADAEMDAKALLKDLSMPKSPKDRAPKSPVMGSPKFCKKSVQNVRVKCAPRRIHQPR